MIHVVAHPKNVHVVGLPKALHVVGLPKTLHVVVEIANLDDFLWDDVAAVGICCRGALDGEVRGVNCFGAAAPVPVAADDAAAPDAPDADTPDADAPGVDAPGVDAPGVAHGAAIA